jgi:hypothetical protein
VTQAFNLSQLANNLDSSGRLDATDGLVNAVPVANGGTGASSVAAAVSNLSASIYPVGSIYINAGVTTNPATLLGFGTWTAFGAGRVMVGLNAGDSAFDTLQETGGSKDATLVSHSHTGTTSSAGAASGSTSGGNGTGDFGIYNAATGAFSLSGSAPNRPQGAGGVGSSTTATLSIPDHNHSFTTSTQGSSATNANLQPYITVCMWLRTA